MVDILGTLSFPAHRMAAHTARMYPVTTNDLPERGGWYFFIAASEPFEEPPVAVGECGDFPNGAALYAEFEPVPLPEMEDFTGLDFSLKEPYHPDHGEVYFTFDAWEARDVSDVQIRFLEKDGSRYRVELSALVYQVFELPTELRYSGWIQVTGHGTQDD
ncbi:MAG: hypothetical protein ACRC8S_10445 [Fimbriiglobus sp.]